MRVLYVATDLRDADVLQQEVRRATPGLTLEICAGLSELRARHDQGTPPDVLLMDCSLSEAEQLQVIHFARVRQLGVPVVGVMGANTQMPSAALTAGLDDLLVRGPRFAERLQPALRLSTERYRNTAQAQRDNEKLRRSESRLRLIIETLPTGVVLMEQNGKILAMNAAGVKLFGNVSPADIVGRTFQTLLPVEDQPGFHDFLATVTGGVEASLQFSGLHDDRDEPYACSLRGLTIPRDEGTSAVLAVLERVRSGAGMQHAWTSEFNLDVAGLTPPLPDAPLDGSPLDAPSLDGAPLGEPVADARALSAQIAELEACVQQADARIAELKEELAQVRAAQAEALDASRAREAALADQVAQARTQHAAALEALQQTVQHEQAQRAAAEEQARSLAASAALAEDAAKQAEAMASLAGDLETARGEIGALTDQLARVTAEAVAQRAAAQGTSAGVDAVRAEKAVIEEELARTKAAHEALQSTAARAASAATAQQQALVTELESLRTELTVSAAALAALRSEQAQKEALLTEQRGQIRELEQRALTRVRELEQEHRVAVDRLQELLNQAIKDAQQAGSAGSALNGSRGADASRRGAERLGRLAAAMAGDLQAAADAATEAAGAVIASLAPGAPGRDAAERTLETVQRSQEMARHLLRMSTRYIGQTSRVDLSQLVRQQEALLDHLTGPDVELQFDLTGGLTSSELDAQEVTQVLTSLTVAARDALTLGGAIRIATTAQRLDPADTRGDHRPLVLAVTARGYGIRPVSSATCEEVAARCGGLLTTVIEPNVSWTLMAMLPGNAAVAPGMEQARSA